MGYATREQPAPVHRPSVTPTWELVIGDLRAWRDRIEGPADSLGRAILDADERDREGRRRYGVRLQPGNGRDSLVDAYQETLDAAVYLRNDLEERPAPANDLRRRQLYEDALRLAVRVRAMIDEREGVASC